MIKNDRQYTLTKKQARHFEEALAAFDAGACPENVHPVIYRAQHDGIESQLQTLRRELKEYEALKEGRIETISLDRLEDLPLGLIKARIARNLNQEQLANRLGIKKQQVQRWEFDNYENVSFSSMVEIADALQLDISECIILTKKPKPAFQGLRQLGLDKNFVKTRLVPTMTKWRLDAMTDTDILVAAAARLRNIFGIDVDATGIVRHDGRMELVGAGRFKVPANADTERARAYAVYAQHLAALVAEAAVDLPKVELPRSWSDLRKALCDSTAPTFENLVESSWKLGVPVLPLRDPIRFHGVCWRIMGRNVIVLKQPVPHESRWSFDLIHELYHAGETPHEDTLNHIQLDVTDPERRESDDERQANELAGNVLLNGRAEELYQQVFAKSGSRISWFKNAVSRVAQAEEVDVGALSNYVAFRLKADCFVDWWGTANNLQPESQNPFDIAREALFRNADLNRLTEDDRMFLEQALSEPAVC